MNAPWFDANTWAWLPGTLFGVTGGICGSVAGICAPLGKARRLVLGFWIALLAIAGVLLTVGLIALAMGQPFAIWFFLLLPGMQGGVILGILYPVILKRYREAEERKMEAKNITSWNDPSINPR